jgi:hypothetical protein
MSPIKRYREYRQKRETKKVLRSIVKQWEGEITLIKK